MKKILLFVFCFLGVIISCSEDNGDKPEWEGYLETQNVVLDPYVNDTIIRYNCECMVGITEVRAIIGEEQKFYEFDYNLNVLQEDWFAIVLQDGAVNVRTLTNSTGMKRELRINMIFCGKSDRLVVVQESAC